MPQLSTYGSPQQQMPQYDMGHIEAEIARAQQQQKMAEALISQGYVPNSGWAGALAQMFSAYKGGKLARKANESISDALEKKLTEARLEREAEIQRLLKEKIADEDRRFEHDKQLAELKPGSPFVDAQGRAWNLGPQGVATPITMGGGAPAGAPPTGAPPSAPMPAGNSETVIAMGNALAKIGMPKDQIDALLTQMPGMSPVSNEQQDTFQAENSAAGGTPDASVQPHGAQLMGKVPGEQKTDLDKRLDIMRGDPAHYSQDDIDALVTGTKPMTAGQKQAMELKRTKARSSVNGVTQDLDIMVKKIDRLLDPKTDLSGITGLSGMFPNTPGGAASDAQALLDSLKNQTGFQVLQKMRQLSPTGGALGNVSDRENERLDTAIQNLTGHQSEDSLKKALGDLREYANQSKQLLNDGYQQDYGAEEIDAKGKSAVSGEKVYDYDASGKRVQ